jgi:DNA topoisomerase I
MVVNDFLVKHFSDIMEYHFTASVEKEFDEIADGKASWTKMIGDFYKPFHEKVGETTKNTERDTGERVLGVDPESGKPVVVKIGRYGPMAQIGESNEEEKPRFAGLLKGQHIGTITLEEALGLFKFPRTIGEFEGKTVVAGIGRFGPFIRHDSKFVSIKPDVDNPVSINLDRAIELILEKREKDQNKYIQTFDEEPGLSVLNGRWGPYISYKGNNYKIPKDTEPAGMSLKDCLNLIKAQDAKGKKGKKPGRKKN